jgi:cardiolipin synthase
MVETIVPIFSALWWLVALYAISVAVFILLDNRSPHLTIAWLLTFYLFPVLGVVVYLLFGREFRVFSKQNKLIRQAINLNLSQQLAHILARQGTEIEKLKEIGPPVYGRLVELMRRTARTPLFCRNSLEILQNGPETYPRLIEDMKAAKHSIHMEYYEWSSDEFTEGIKQILLSKVQEGVEVRLLYDPIGSFFMLNQSYVREMNAGGVKMVPYSPVYRLHTISYRNHRKIVVIDGKIGYTGGLNMAQTYLKGPDDDRFSGWRDTHARFTGEAVWALQASFVVQWYNTTEEKLVDLVYFPPVAEAHGYLPLQIVNSGPDSQWSAIRYLYFALITGAQRHVYIQTPFFILDDSLAVALSGAARSGINVKVMLAPDGPDGGFAYRAGYTYAQNMARAGVRIFYYQGDYFHAKTINVDSLVCSIGSANMDIRSFTINYESNLVIYDEKAAKKLEQDFLNDLEHCLEFDLMAYRRSPVWSRARDSFYRLFSPLL